jgi:hypothetical protein
MHDQFQMLFSSGKAGLDIIIRADNHMPELTQFHAFYKDHILCEGLTPHKTDWMFRAPGNLLAGCIDLRPSTRMDL